MPLSVATTSTRKRLSPVHTDTAAATVVVQYTLYRISAVPCETDDSYYESIDTMMNALDTRAPIEWIMDRVIGLQIDDRCTDLYS